MSQQGQAEVTVAEWPELWVPLILFVAVESHANLGRKTGRLSAGNNNTAGERGANEGQTLRYLGRCVALCTYSVISWLFQLLKSSLCLPASFGRSAEAIQHSFRLLIFLTYPFLSSKWLAPVFVHLKHVDDLLPPSRLSILCVWSRLSMADFQNYYVTQLLIWTMLNLLKVQPPLACTLIPCPKRGTWQNRAQWYPPAKAEPSSPRPAGVLSASAWTQSSSLPISHHSFRIQLASFIRACGRGGF